MQSVPLGNMSVDILQCKPDFSPEAKLEEVFIYIFDKHISIYIDYSYALKILGHMVIDLKELRVSSSNLLPSSSTKVHLFSLSELVDRK